MSARIRIAIDAMSGDLGPRVAMSAALKFSAIYDDVDLLLVGDEQQLLVLSSASELNRHHITIVHAPDLVAMNEDPLVALRHKKKSSMWRAIEIVKNNDADACVSAGNTGALLAMSMHLIKTFSAIERPAICKAMPTEKDVTFMLDLGANINCSAKQLHQFALMGSVLAATSTQKKPRIGLLNVGTESNKGTEIIKAAQVLLQADKRLNYSGFVEANSLFLGDVDVIVCDGFHGNLALKSSEGTASFIAKKIHKSIKKNWCYRVLGLIAWPLLRRWRTELDPSMYNGASFLGLQKIVVKSHGDANTNAFLRALIVAREQVVLQVPARIQQQLSNN